MISFFVLLTYRYGRKFILIIGSVSSAILGTARSFTTEYYSFLLFELLDSIASSGVYAATFVLGEKSNPRVHKICYKINTYIVYVNILCIIYVYFRSRTSQSKIPGHRQYSDGLFLSYGRSYHGLCSLYNSRLADNA